MWQISAVSCNLSPSFSFSLFLFDFLVHFFVFNTCASRKSFKFAFNVCDILFETRKKYARQCAKWRRIVHRAYQAGRSKSSVEHRSSSNACVYIYIYISIYIYIYLGITFYISLHIIFHLNISLIIHLSVYLSTQPSV